ncbi:MAG: 5'/3'-nucleotidase SurE [Spirochaetaceae bacterium]
MRVLLTNDDGIDSPGLEAIRDALEQDHEVWVLAPESERSAMSHYITIKDPVRCLQVDEQAFASSGSPADCVILGLLGALPIEPDVVVSGINIGPNLGTDIIYSGTAAAARQAAIMRKPGIALSIDGFDEPFHFEPFARFVREHLEELVSLWDVHHFININSPNTAEWNKPVEITSPSTRIYHDKLSEFRTPRGEVYFFMGGAPVTSELEPGTDWHAVSQGSISVSPIYINPVNHKEDAAYREAAFLRQQA